MRNGLLALVVPALMGLGCSPAATPGPTAPSRPAAPLLSTQPATSTPRAAAGTPAAEQAPPAAGQPPTLVPTPTPDLGVRIEAQEEALLVVADEGSPLSASVVPAAAEIAGVETAGGYLVADLSPVRLVGLAPGSPLPFGAQLVEGSGLEAEGPDSPVAIVGRRIVAESFTSDPGAMPGMVHALQIGQSFAFPGSDLRLRVVGRYAAADPALELSVFAPLSAAQQISGRDGVSHVWVRLAAGADPSQAEAALRALILKARSP